MNNCCTHCVVLVDSNCVKVPLVYKFQSVKHDACLCRQADREMAAEEAHQVETKPHVLNLNIAVPMDRLQREFALLGPKSSVDVYWVDEKEWRPAIVSLAWNDEEFGMTIYVTWPNHPKALPEELHLEDKTVYNRIRFGKPTEPDRAAA